jgi:hypothetical protein
MAPSLRFTVCQLWIRGPIAVAPGVPKRRLSALRWPCTRVQGRSPQDPVNGVVPLDHREHQGQAALTDPQAIIGLNVLLTSPEQPQGSTSGHPWRISSREK